VNILLLALVACADVPETAADCHPTRGDNCSCDAKCMTDAEIAAIDDFCDLGCIGEIDWTCDVVDDACVVVMP
jgi:hypothetical protein